ncbi:Uncharacterised protein [Vibrio cholerae]|nr:Uncharacterised protein [Vibrio cholerae]
MNMVSSPLIVIFGSVETINLRRYTMKLSPRLNIF